MTPDWKETLLMYRLSFFVVLFFSLVGLFLPANAESISEIFQRINPAVVVIHTSERVATPQTETGFTSVAGLGSGFIISEEGHVMTAAHVVQAADAVVVEFHDGKQIPARVVSSAPEADVSLLMLEKIPSDMVVVKLGDSDKANVGDQAFIIGAPYGVSHTLTVGYISGRHSPDTRYGGLFAAEMLQTDTAINQGNSGGPMFNMAGEAIGIVSHIMSQSGGSEGLGFVITSNLARELLLEKKSVWFGLQGHFLSGEMAKILNVPPPGVGILVQKVAAGSPAEALGLQGGTYQVKIQEQEVILGGDIILEVMGVSLSESEKVRRLLYKLKPGQTLRLSILRGGKTMNIMHQMTAEELPD